MKTVIRYCDLIKCQSDRVDYLKRTRDKMRSDGVTRFEAINRTIEISERIFILLKHSQKEMQTDLDFLNTQLNHKA